MTKLVKLNFVGSFENGFTVSIEIRDQKKARVVAKSLDYSLSSDVEIPKLYKIWRSAYEKLGPPPRILLGENKRTNISSLEDRRNCRILAKQLSDRFNRPVGKQKQCLEQILLFPSFFKKRPNRSSISQPHST